MTHLPNDLLQKIADTKSNILGNKIWLATTFSLSRNLSVFKFLPCLSKEKKLELLDVVRERFAQLENFGVFHFIYLKDLSLWQREFLSEHFLFPYDLTGNPEGEAVLIHESGEILVTVNIHDHLILHAIDLNGEPEKTLDRLIQLDSRLHDCLSFAFSPDFGFLTTHPFSCGTALKVQCFLHIPAVIQSQKEDVFVDHDNEVSFSGLLPGVAGCPGNILVLSNVYTLGLTEEHILSTLRIWASKLSAAEESARKQYKDQCDSDVKNHISRSLGLLTHSYCLDLDESLDALSWLQFGLDLQYVFCKKNESIPSAFVPLFWPVRRGHLAWSHQPEDQRSLEKEVVTQLRAHVLKSFAESLDVKDF